MATTSVTLLDRLRGRPSPADGRRFVDLYAPLLHRYACARGVPDADAADLVQDVLVVLLDHLPRFEYRPGQGFRRWLFTILLNKWRDRKRAVARQRAAPLGPGLPDPPADDPAGLLGEEEYRRQLVTRAIGTDEGGVRAGHLAGLLGAGGARPPARSCGPAGSDRRPIRPMTPERCRR